MASTYSTNLALELIGTGDQAGTWGVTTNTNLGTLLEQAISGYVTQAVSTGTDTTITIPNGSTGVARNMYIELTGTGGTNTNLIVPANKKLYFIFNNASGAVTVKVSGQTGVSVPAGKKMILVSNGTDIVNGVNYIADFGTNSFTVTNLTATSATITNLIATTATVSDLSATVLRAASASITNLALTSLTISSLSITNVSVASATVSSNLTLSGGTANGVLYLNGSKVATSGTDLVFTSTGLGIGTSSLQSGTRLTLQESASNPSGLAIRNRNSTQTWQVSVDAAAVDDKILAFIDPGAGVVRMALDSSGNLGIGNTSPATTLSVGSSAGSGSNSLGIYLARGATTNFLEAYDGTKTFIGGTDSSNAFVKVGSLSNHPLAIVQENGAAIYIDTSKNVGIGTTSPFARLQVVDSSANYTSPQLMVGEASNATGKQLHVGYNTTANTGYIQAVHNGTAYKDLLLNPNGGNLGLCVTPNPSWEVTAKAFQISDAGQYLASGATNFSSANLLWLGNNGYLNSSSQWIYLRSVGAAQYRQLDNTHAWFIAPSGTAGNTISFTQAMTLDASARWQLNTTTFVGNEQAIIQFNSSGSVTQALNTRDSNASANNNSHIVLRRSDDTYLGSIGRASTDTAMFLDGNSYLSLRTGATERARITSGGDLLVKKTTPDATSEGIAFESNGRGIFTSNSATECLLLNRQDSDGTLVDFRQANTTEGSISVSGNTVSYNAFAGSHWSQLQDGSKPDILRGTVMESINELCVWPNEKNERLPKAKISDTVGSKKVYGVFMAWDNDWTTTNDMYVTAVGAFICRVNGSVTVQEGDLLESNGDGTARVQADDIIRSSTIGKVTSTVKTHQYGDGSYCVPTVLYCG